MAMACSSPAACAASELVAKGRESAAILQALLGQHPVVADEMPDGLLDLTEKILRCCDRALAALSVGTEDPASGARKRTMAAAAPLATSSKRMRVSGGEKGRRVEKQQTMEDGFIWRKYGQKEICDSKYPRLYFRCTYKDDRGCMAKRQVQQSEANHSVYLITYFGEHTCCRHDDEPPAPFVINFGSSTCGDGQPNVSPWSSCGDDDDGLAVSETSDLCNSPEKELAELIEQSTAVPEQVAMSSWEWDPLDGCLDWELADEDTSSFDIGQFISFDYIYLLQ
ncbi:hypothetical protein PR202_ga05442 [Eleusine coracana subsp. coracana]|uniref:WRKY domain-containing protein n=1 Tax=Eleusine coracana subsp. coracana TaxID=191504 RepID=A0AAV5BU23_ELECO|nr:hypothetical protein QOZ80_5AG0369670 [Eleusine coracana subsp. coracana]GJM88868.1 hypothetical protein PR202_ga04989 [Eleusine coracana subsp. coracana]GJM89269.1 hypothetical protein PR202_ga05442 [Eleusine coracana subsp. coracana]